MTSVAENSQKIIEKQQQINRKLSEHLDKYLGANTEKNKSLQNLLQRHRQFIRQIKEVLNNLRDKNNVVIRFVGHTDNIPLEERQARIYGGHDALSKARARRVAFQAPVPPLEASVPSSAARTSGSEEARSGARSSS